MGGLDQILENNKDWAGLMLGLDPECFNKVAREQAPEYLWIGCSDSRVEASRLTGLQQGELFVHRNIANLFSPNDKNASAVLQYAVEVLKVKKIIVCGHYGCGGVAAALAGEAPENVNSWIAPIREVISKNQGSLDAIEDLEDRQNFLAELSAMDQARKVLEFPSVMKAAHELTVHTCIYSIKDGVLKELGPMNK